MHWGDEYLAGAVPTAQRRRASTRSRRPPSAPSRQPELKHAAVKSSAPCPGACWPWLAAGGGRWLAREAAQADGPFAFATCRALRARTLGVLAPPPRAAAEACWPASQGRARPGLDRRAALCRQAGQHRAAPGGPATPSSRGFLLAGDTRCRGLDQTLLRDDGSPGPPGAAAAGRRTRAAGRAVARARSAPASMSASPHPPAAGTGGGRRETWRTAGRRTAVRHQLRLLPA